MKKQQGFSIVTAISILIVVGLLGGFMVRLGGVQHNTAVMALQGARAYQAARAGVDWAVARLSGGGTCVDVNAQTALTLSGINGFTVSLTCTVNTYKEGVKNLSVYRLNALSHFGTYASADYVSRELEISMVLEN